MVLVKPAREHVPSYADALRRGYSPMGSPETPSEMLDRLERSPDSFLAHFDDPHALAGPAWLPDGTIVKRLPSIGRWIWDGEFCGTIGLRWRPGTVELPPTCLGHIGYEVVPWKRRLGYATAALAQMLPEAREMRLPYVEIVTNIENVASQRVIVANGGALVEQFEKPRACGGGVAYRYRIAL